jgi:phage terminase Nu1 subunit (DNA packaging protein)
MAYITSEIKDSAKMADIAAHLDLSRQRLRTLIRNAVLPSRGTVDEYRIVYIRWLRTAATGHAIQGGKVSADGRIDLTVERAKLTRAQTEKTEIEVAYLKGDALPRPRVTEVWQMHAAAVRSRFLGLTSKLKLLIPHLTYDEGEIVDKEVREILEELAGDGLPAEAKAAAVRHMRKYGKRH